jgi:hypothetical protein
LITEKILEILFIVSIGLLFGYLIVDNVATKVKNKKLFVRATQAELDRISVYEQTKEILKREAERVEGSDGFLRFVSDSRDWAFSYIEEAQGAITNFKNSVEAIIVSYQVDKSTPLTEKEMQQIADAYDELVKVLPKD